MAFAITATVLSAGSTIYSANKTSSAARDAANTQAAATQSAIDEQRRQFDINQENQKPYLDAGKVALGKLANENDIPFDASKVQLDPGYQFGLTEGQKAIDRKTAAAGGRISGAALKAAAQYGTDYATTGYNTAYNRQNQARTDRLNRLAALAGIGQTATTQIGNQGAYTSGNTANLITSQGNATGASQIAQGNIWGNAVNQLGAMGQKWANSYTPTDSGGYESEMSRLNNQAAWG